MAAEDDSVRIQSSSDRYYRRIKTEDLKDNNQGSSARSNGPRLSALSLDLVEIKIDSGREVDPSNFIPLSERPTLRALRLVNQQ